MLQEGQRTEEVHDAVDDDELESAVFDKAADVSGSLHVVALTEWRARLGVHTAAPSSRHERRECSRGPFGRRRRNGLRRHGCGRGERFPWG